MPGIHPDIVIDWRIAKRAAAAIATVIGAEIGQSPDGKTKTVKHNGRLVQCVSWLAVYTYCHSIRADQIRPPTAQPWTGPVPAKVLPAVPR